VNLVNQCYALEKEQPVTTLLGGQETGSGIAQGNQPNYHIRNQAPGRVGRVAATRSSYHSGSTDTVLIRLAAPNRHRELHSGDPTDEMRGDHLPSDIN
jgi:hypothetical protein